MRCLTGPLRLHLRLQRVRLPGSDADHQPASPCGSGLLDDLLGPGLLPHPRDHLGGRVHPRQPAGHTGLHSLRRQHRMGHPSCHQVEYADLTLN